MERIGERSFSYRAQISTAVSHGVYFEFCSFDSRRVRYRINKHAYTNINSTGIITNACYRIILSSNVFAFNLMEKKKLIIVLIEHAEGSPEERRIARSSWYHLFFVDRGERTFEKSLSEPRRAEALFPWYTWTSIVLARETLHFQPIGISHSHGAKHCFVENFSSVCLSTVFPFSTTKSVVLRRGRDPASIAHRRKRRKRRV